MTNSDKVKAARRTDKGKKYMAKCVAINDAQKQNHKEERRLRGIHNAAAQFEDSMRMTEHEAAMLEAKQKREAKAAKAREFRACAELAANANLPMKIDGEPAGAPGAPGAKVVVPANGDSAAVRQIGRHVAVALPAAKPSEEKRCAQVAAMVEARRRTFERARQANVMPAGRHAAAADVSWAIEPAEASALESTTACCAAEGEDELDGLLARLMDERLLDETHVDRLTDAIACRSLSAQRCTALVRQALVDGNVSALVDAYS